MKEDRIKNPCERCGVNEATQKFGDALAFTHGGGANYCERCVVDEQVIHARERAAELYGLEKRLVELGGPPARVICGWTLWQIQGDPTPIGSFCLLPEGHEGRHDPWAEIPTRDPITSIIASEE